MQPGDGLFLEGPRRRPSPHGDSGDAGDRAGGGPAASALVLWGGDFDTILGYFLFMTVLLIALSVAALFVLRRSPVAGRAR